MTRDSGMIVFAVDHDPNFLDLIRAQLGPKGFLIQTFTRGGDLISAMEEAVPEGTLPKVVLIAAILPDRNGLELCKKIKEHRPFSGCKVAIMSAIQRSSRMAVDAKTHFLADEYLTLPLDFVALPQIVQKIASSEALSVAAPESSVETKAPEGLFKDPGRGQTGAAKRRTSKPEAAAESGRLRPGKEEPSGGDAEKSAKPVVERKFSRPNASFRSSREKIGNRNPEIPTEGKLEDILFPELLLALYQDRATGVLSIQYRDEERRIALQSGIPISIDTNFIVGHTLGAILIEQERITRDQLRQAQAEAKESGRRLGELLVELGFIETQELMDTLHFQARKKLMSAFEHREGWYRFEPSPATPENLRQLDESILRILLAGVKNYCTLAILENRIYINKHRVIAKTDYRRLKRAGLQLTSKEWAVLDLVDGARTLGEIIGRTDLNFIRTFQVLYLFFLFGIIRFADEGRGFFHLEEPAMDRALVEAKSPVSRVGQIQMPVKSEDAGKETDLVRLLYRLNALRADGIVNVKNEGVVHEIVLAGGKPVRISSETVTELSLGNLMVTWGWVTKKQQEAALDEARESRKPLGEVLLGKGLLSPHQIYQALVLQAEERLLRLTQTTGPVEIQYQTQTNEDPNRLPLDIDILKVLITALRSRVGRDKIASELSYHMRHSPNIPFPVRERVQKNVVDPRESQLVSQINGKRTLQEILGDSPLSKDHTESLIYALFRLSLIEFLSD